MIFYTFINLVINFVTLIVNVLLVPINLLINNYLPNVANSLTSIDSFLDIINLGLAYAVSWSLLLPTTLAFVTAYWTFVLTVPITIYFIKLFLKWYKVLKP